MLDCERGLNKETDKEEKLIWGGRRQSTKE